jgi:hypothetical protein
MRAILLPLALLAASSASGQDADELAKHLANPIASQVLPIGRQMASLHAGGAWYVEAPAGSPDWSLRLTVTLLYKDN